jgi:perosamine synthetase
MINVSSPALDSSEIQAVVAVLRSGMLAQGARVAEFEEAFAAYIGTKHAIAVNSGTAALHIALLASGIGEGDEVITTPFTFISTANAILFCGARPIFADIDEATFNIDPDRIREKITPRTKAILPVHLYGQPCDMDKISGICHEHHLALIEDACQAHGAKYHSARAGSFGTGCFSFYPTKNMTTGEGGMITTNDGDLAARARMLRSHGQSERYMHEALGYNYRMTDIAAAIGICQLAGLEESTRKRIENALFLSQEIDSIEGLIPPFVAPGVKHVFSQFTIRVTGSYGTTRNELQQKLREKGVESSIHYPLPVHFQPLYRKLGYDDSLPNAEKAAGEVLSLPVHPGLNKEDLKTIVRALRAARR